MTLNGGVCRRAGNATGKRILGCGGQDGLVIVSGIATHDGKPVEDLVVVFAGSWGNKFERPTPGWRFTLLYTRDQEGGSANTRYMCSIALRHGHADGHRTGNRQDSGRGERNCGEVWQPGECSSRSISSRARKSTEARLTPPACVAGGTEGASDQSRTAGGATGVYGDRTCLHGQTRRRRPTARGSIVEDRVAVGRAHLSPTPAFPPVRASRQCSAKGWTALDHLHAVGDSRGSIRLPPLPP